MIKIAFIRVYIYLLSFSSKKLTLILLNISNNIFKIIFMLKLPHEKIFSTKQDFFFLFTTLKKVITISNVLKL